MRSLNVKRANKTYAVIARRERELRTRIKRGVPGRKWFYYLYTFPIKESTDSYIIKERLYIVSDKKYHSI